MVIYTEWSILIDVFVTRIFSDMPERIKPSLSLCTKPQPILLDSFDTNNMAFNVIIAHRMNNA